MLKVVYFIPLISSSCQSKKALKNILQKCTYLPALEPLLYDAPSNILKHVVCQFSKVSEQDHNKSAFKKKSQVIRPHPTPVLMVQIAKADALCLPSSRRCCLMTAKLAVCL